MSDKDSDCVFEQLPRWSKNRQNGTPQIARCPFQFLSFFQGAAAGLRNFWRALGNHFSMRTRTHKHDISWFRNSIFASSCIQATEHIRQMSTPDLKLPLGVSQTEEHSSYSSSTLKRGSVETEVITYSDCCCCCKYFISNQEGHINVWPLHSISRNRDKNPCGQKLNRNKTKVESMLHPTCYDIDNDVWVNRVE